MSTRAPLAIALFIAAALLFLLAGCATRALLPPVAVAFDRAHAEALLKPGTNTIKGSAFMRQNGGAVVTCAGNKIALVPRTAYAEARFAALYPASSGGINLVNLGGVPERSFAEGDAAPGYMEAHHETTCDVQGFFTFDNVADGSFYVLAGVHWRVPGSSFVPNYQGGAIAKPVTVQGGKVVNVVLAP